MLFILLNNFSTIPSLFHFSSSNVEEEAEADVEVSTYHRNARIFNWNGWWVIKNTEIIKRKQ